MGPRLTALGGSPSLAQRSGWARGVAKAKGTLGETERVLVGYQGCGRASGPVRRFRNTGGINNCLPPPGNRVSPVSPLLGCTGGLFATILPSPCPSSVDGEGRASGSQCFRPCLVCNPHRVTLPLFTHSEGTSRPSFLLPCSHVSIKH